MNFPPPRSFTPTEGIFGCHEREGLHSRATFRGHPVSVKLLFSAWVIQETSSEVRYDRKDNPCYSAQP